MIEHNAKMAAMLAAGLPARDLNFEIAVMARIEQRRFARNMAFNIGMAALAMLLLALLAPQLDWAVMLAGNWSGALSGLTGNTLVMLALLVAAFAAWKLRPGAEA